MYNEAVPGASAGGARSSDQKTALAIGIADPWAGVVERAVRRRRPEHPPTHTIPLSFAGRQVVIPRDPYRPIGV